MRRKLSTLLLPVVVGIALLLPAQVASAEVQWARGDDVVRLATEAEGGTEGLEPGGANSTDNPNRPEEYEPPFIWAAAVGLSVLTVAGLGILFVLYRVMVARDDKEPSRS